MLWCCCDDAALEKVVGATVAQGAEQLVAGSGPNLLTNYYLTWFGHYAVGPERLPAVESVATPACPAGAEGRRFPLRVSGGGARNH